MKTTLRSLGLCLAAALGGCGNPDPAAVTDYIHSLAVESCAWEFRCCSDTEIMSLEMSKFKDEATCVKFRELSMQNTLYAERLAVREGRIKVDGGNADACLAAAKAKMCNPKPGTPAPTPPAPGTVDPCTQVFVGSTSVGNECLFANECVKGAHCVATGAAGGRGVCVPYQQANEICNTTSDCDPSVFNLYCARQDFQCHLRSAVGGPCAYTMDMTTGMATLPLLLECDTNNGLNYCDSATSTCKSLPGSGQPCLAAPRPPGVTASCQPGLQCDMSGGAPGVCRGPGNVGDDCTSIPCMTGLYCDTTVTPRTCKALPSLGEQCQPSGFACAKPYWCNTGTAPPYLCAAPIAAGQPCTNANSCDTGLYCDTSNAPVICKMQLPDGSPCTTFRQCLSNNCQLTAMGQVCQPATSQICSGR